MQRDILVSVIVPVYNTGEYLSLCVESLTRQQATDVEFIFVDDGSTDNSLDILKSYSTLDKRVVVYSQENGGVSSARNLGLEKCTGDFVFFLDSDDQVDKNFFALILPLLRECQTDLLLFKYGNITKAEEIDNTCVYNKVKLHKKLFLDGFFSSVYTLGVHDKIFNRRCIKGVRFDVNLIHSEEISFLLKYLTAIENAISINNVLYYKLFTRKDSAVSQLNSKNISINWGHYLSRYKSYKFCYTYVESHFPEYVVPATIWLFRESTKIVQYVFRNHIHNVNFDEELVYIVALVSKNKKVFFQSWNKWNIKLKSQLKIELILLSFLFFKK